MLPVQVPDRLLDHLLLRIYKVLFAPCGARLTRCALGLRNLRRYTFFCWRIRKFDVGEYTVFTIENPSWRIHSFHYRKSLKESENTQFLVENTQV
jgi:hypothetical protein